jgi:NADH dehydrogenase
MKQILIVGGGYAGLYAAWTLEKKLHTGEAEVTVLDPRPYMTYQPFLPEVVSGSIEPRHTVVPLRRHLRHTRLVAGSATGIDHAHKTVTAVGADGQTFTVPYDVLVVTAGAVTRVLPIPGLVDVGIGLKTVEEAVAIRNHLLTALDRAATLPPGPERVRALTVTFVGGGFSGVEGFGEALSLAEELVHYYPEIQTDELHFHLVEARDRILPEVTDRPGRWVVQHLRSRGAEIHLGAFMTSAQDNHVVLSSGIEFDSGLIVWTAGNGPNPVVAQRSDLPVDTAGYLVTRADLRVGTSDGWVPDVWAAGDNAVIPDLAVGKGAFTVPNAQHAVRQAKRLADNLVADLRGKPPREYVHRSLGTIATLGHGHGLFQYKKIVVKGWLAWAMHRGYHVLAVPSWERKIRVLLGWFGAFVGHRDVASLAATVAPRAAFVGSTLPSPVSPRAVSEGSATAGPGPKPK